MIERILGVPMVEHRVDRRPPHTVDLDELEVRLEHLRNGETGDIRDTDEMGADMKGHVLALQAAIDRDDLPPANHVEAEPNLVPAE